MTKARANSRLQVKLIFQMKIQEIPMIDNQKNPAHAKTMHVFQILLQPLPFVHPTSLTAKLKREGGRRFTAEPPSTPRKRRGTQIKDNHSLNIFVSLLSY